MSNYCAKNKLPESRTLKLSREMNSTFADDTINTFTWQQVQWHWWVILQVCLAIVGFFGNSIVIIIYAMKNRLDRATSFFIRALAVADLITSVNFLPRRIALSTPDSLNGHLYCKLVASNFLLWLSIVAAIFTLTTISVERYIAVVHPIKYRIYFSKTLQPKIVVACIWLTSFVINSHSFFVTYRDPKTGACLVGYQPPYLQMVFGTLVFVIEFFLPVVIMITTQLITIDRLLKQAKLTKGARTTTINQTKGDLANSQMMRTRRKVLKMLFVVIVTFIICWTPDQVAFLLFNFNYFKAVDFLGTDLYHILVSVAFVNSCANPFIYAASNSQFRASFRRIFYCKREIQPLVSVTVDT